MRTISVTLTVAAALWIAPAAHADTIALSVAPDPVEDAGFLVTTSGEGSADANLYALIEPARSTGCAATYPALTADNYVAIDDNSAEGDYAITGTAQVHDPGRYQLCAWLQPSKDSSAAYATTRQLVDVRSARASVGIGGPRSARRGRSARFSVSGHSELRRWLEVDLNRAGGRPCDTAPALGSQPILLSRVDGGFQFSARVPHGRIVQPGRYLLCAWVIEGVLDRHPEAVANSAFRVTRRH